MVLIMTILQLKYIVAVDTHRSFSKAAKISYVTQPTLSMQIQKLEEELGVLIFDRSKKPVQPTPIGEQIIHQARVNLQGMKRIEEIVQEDRDVISGKLHIGIIPTLAPYLLPLFVTSFLSKYPTVSLSIEEFISVQIIQKLKQNLLDVGILVTPLQDKDISEIPIFYETFVVYISTNHPLINNDLINIKNLNVGEMLLLSEGHCFRNQVVNICPDNKSQRQEGRLRFESGSLETLKKIIEQNYGYTLLPELATLDISQDRRKHIRELTPPKPVREVSLVIHRNISKKKLIMVLKDHILENLPKNMKDRNRGMIIDWL
jgi:LysR family hydrogen peroxide-inducible transcriptional activator